MNVRKILILGLGLGVLGIQYVQGETRPASFRDLVKSADLIVEGTVVDQIDINGGARWKDRVCRKLSTFKITHIEKGSAVAGQTISVLSHFDLIGETGHLEKNTHYLLMLKSASQGYADVADGRGTYQIVDLAPNRQAAVNSASPDTDTLLLSQLHDNIAWALSEPPPATTQPALSVDFARAIAEKMIAQTGIDLSEYKLQKPILFKANVAVTGIAYEDEPMWHFNWHCSDAGAGGDDNTNVYCYVNARTGKAICGPRHPKTGFSAQDKCRIFLATYKPTRQKFQSAVSLMTIKYITQEEFVGFLPLLQNLYLTPPNDFPEGTSFLYGEFPKSANLPSILFVLSPERTVDFVGELHPKK